MANLDPNHLTSVTGRCMVTFIVFPEDCSLSGVLDSPNPVQSLYRHKKEQTYVWLYL